MTNLLKYIFLTIILLPVFSTAKEKKINIEKECQADSLEYHYAADILPIPIDQRYGKEDMIKIAEMVKMTMNIKEE